MRNMNRFDLVCAVTACSLSRKPFRYGGRFPGAVRQSPLNHRGSGIDGTVADGALERAFRAKTNLATNPEEWEEL